MAKMYPHYEDYEIDRRITNKGEKEVYKALKTLPDSFEVIYSDVYFPKDKFQGETDFIILHPNYGMMLVEVKGGDIEYKDRKWFRNGEELNPNPIEQVSSALFFYRSKYTEIEHKAFAMPHTYCLFFPHTVAIKGEIPLENERVFIKNDITEIESKIKKAFKSRTPIQKFDNNFSNTIKILKDKVFRVLGAEFISENLGNWINSFDKNANIIFTQEQKNILNSQFEQRILTFGPAGSGKTLVAIEKAIKLADEENKRVLLTCFNSPLGDFIKRKIDEKCKNRSLITVGNYHQISYEILSPYGFKFPERKNSYSGIQYEFEGRMLNQEEASEFFKFQVPNLLIDYEEQYLRENSKYDALIVDEGQDFNDLWLLSLKALLKEEAEVYAFADEIQSINRNYTLKDIAILFKKEFTDIYTARLSCNLRNTEKIHDLLLKFNNNGYSGLPRIKGGKKVRYKSYLHSSDELEITKEIISYLIAQGVKPEQIVILSPQSKTNSSLRMVNEIAGYKLIPDHIPQEHTIRFQTIKRFKGLESDVVLLLGLDIRNSFVTNHAIYVACSRAKYLLYVIHHKNWSLERQIRRGRFVTNY